MSCRASILYFSGPIQVSKSYDYHQLSIWSQNLSNSKAIGSSYPNGRAAPYYHWFDRFSHLVIRIATIRICCHLGDPGGPGNQGYQIYGGIRGTPHYHGSDSFCDLVMRGTCPMTKSDTGEYFKMLKLCQNLFWCGAAHILFWSWQFSLVQQSKKLHDW